MTMVKNITSNFVNWVDGMKLSKDHFIGQERAVRDHIRDAIVLGLSDHHYGLVDGIDIEFDGREVRLLRCRAVCRDGSRVEVLPEHEQHVKTDLSTFTEPTNEGKTFYLLVMVHPNTAEGIGPYVGEPPRQETTVLRTSMEAMPTERLNSMALRSAMLPIGKFTITQGQIVPAKDFIPAWCFIDGCSDHERLRKDLVASLEVLSRGSVAVLGKLYSKPREIQDRFPNRCYEHWAIQTLGTTARINAELSLGMERPYELVRSVVELARIVEGIWLGMPERLDLMKHVEGIGNWANLIRAMQTSISRLVNLNYQHWDLAAIHALCKFFLEQTRQVYAQLGELDRFDAVTVMRDVPKETQEEVIKPKEPEKPKTSGFKWDQK